MVWCQRDVPHKPRCWVCIGIDVSVLCCNACWDATGSAPHLFSRGENYGKVGSSRRIWIIWVGLNKSPKALGYLAKCGYLSVSMLHRSICAHVQQVLFIIHAIVQKSKSSHCQGSVFLTDERITNNLYLRHLGDAFKAEWVTKCFCYTCACQVKVKLHFFFKHFCVLLFYLCRLNVFEEKTRSVSSDMGDLKMTYMAESLIFCTWPLEFRQRVCAQQCFQPFWHQGPRLYSTIFKAPLPLKKNKLDKKF